MLVKCLLELTGVCFSHEITAGHILGKAFYQCFRSGSLLQYFFKDFKKLKKNLKNSQNLMSRQDPDADPDGSVVNSSPDTDPLFGITDLQIRDTVFMLHHHRSKVQFVSKKSMLVF